MTLEELTQEVRHFADERAWERFHTPKNLVMAVAGEAGELVAELQWDREEDIERTVLADPDRRARLEHEVADVFLYLVRLADVCDIDLIAAGRRKLTLNAERYRPDRAYGSSAKYTELQDSADGEPQ